MGVWECVRKKHSQTPIRPGIGQLFHRTGIILLLRRELLNISSRGRTGAIEGMAVLLVVHPGMITNL